MKNWQDYKRKIFSYHTIIVVSIIIGVIFWDLLSKNLTEGFEVQIIDKIISFYSTHNTGGAWSILRQHTWILTVFSIIAILGVSVFDFFFFKKSSKLYTTALALILGGGLGNLFDRLFLGYVRDFIRLEFINFPIFNIADSCLVIGVILMCVFILFIYPKLEEKQANKNLVVSDSDNLIEMNNEKQVDVENTKTEEANKNNLLEISKENPVEANNDNLDAVKTNKRSRTKKANVINEELEDLVNDIEEVKVKRTRKTKTAKEQN